MVNRLVGSFIVYKKDGKLVVPSKFVIRDLLVRIDPQELDAAFRQWNKVYGIEDESLAIDGKAMCNAIDKDGHQTHIMSIIGHESNNCHTGKKVGMIATTDKDKFKRTNEIKIAAPMLDAIDIKGRLITADALLTQRDFARYLVEDRKAHYHFTVKANQKNLAKDVSFYFKNKQEPDFVEQRKLSHGRIEIRKIWVTSSLTRIFHRIALFSAYHVDIKEKYEYPENVHFVTKLAMQFLEKFQRSFCQIHLQT